MQCMVVSGRAWSAQPILVESVRSASFAMNVTYVHKDMAAFVGNDVRYWAEPDADDEGCNPYNYLTR